MDKYGQIDVICCVRGSKNLSQVVTGDQTPLDTAALGLALAFSKPARSMKLTSRGSKTQKTKKKG